MLRSLWRPESGQCSWDSLCLSPGVRGKVGMRILLNSRSKHANSTSISKLVICPVPDLLGRGACLHSSWSHPQAARARLAGDWWVAVGMWQASRYWWPHYLWKHKLSCQGAPAFAEAVLFSGKCCLQLFSAVVSCPGPPAQVLHHSLFGLFPRMENRSEWIGLSICLQINSSVLYLPLAQLQLQLPSLLGRTAEC